MDHFHERTSQLLERVFSYFVSYGSKRVEHVETVDSNDCPVPDVCSGGGSSGDRGGCGIIAVPAAVVSTFRCDKCYQTGVTYVAKNANGLNMHVRSIHGIRNPILWLIRPCVQYVKAGTTRGYT